MSVVTVLFLTGSLLGLLFSDMVRVVDCHVGVLGSNPGGPKRFSPWNYFTCGSGYWEAPESASGREQDSSPTRHFTDTIFEDSSPTDLKTVHRQN